MSSASVAYNERKTCWERDWVQQQMGASIQVDFYFEGEGRYMYCKLCREFDTKNCQKQSKVRNKEACTTVRKEKLNMRHPLQTGKYDMHAMLLKKFKEATQGQVVHCTSERCCD